MDLCTESDYDRAVDVVHRHRAASVALLQRQLNFEPAYAQALLQRMTRDGTFVRELESGLFDYLPPSMAIELAALRGFARAVMASWPHADLAAGTLHGLAVEHGLLHEIRAAGPCSETCSCATLFSFPVTCYRKAAAISDHQSRPK